MTLQHDAGPDARSQPQQRLVVRLLSPIKAQPRMSAGLGLLVCVLLVLLLCGALRPRSASGDATNLLPPSAAASQEVAAAALEGLLRGPIPTLPAIQSPGAAGLPLPRNIFAVDLRRFPKTGSAPGEGRVAVQEANEAATAEVRLAELKRQVAAFRLEGTVTGPSIAAFIDGTNVREGDVYRGFRVVRILSQAVQLERDGVRLELRMPEY
jgi:hypothetical protein